LGSAPAVVDADVLGVVDEPLPVVDSEVEGVDDAGEVVEVVTVGFASPVHPAMERNAAIDRPTAYPLVVTLCTSAPSRNASAPIRAQT